MKARRTPWWYYPLLALIGFLLGLIVATLMTHHASSMVSAPWYVSASIVGVGSCGGVVSMASSSVRSSCKISKCLLNVALIRSLWLSCGMYSSHVVWLVCRYFVVVIQHADVSYFASVSWETAMAAIACLIDVGLG